MRQEPNILHALPGATLTIPYSCVLHAHFAPRVFRARPPARRDLECADLGDVVHRRADACSAGGVAYSAVALVAAPSKLSGVLSPHETKGRKHDGVHNRAGADLRAPGASERSREVDRPRVGRSPAVAHESTSTTSSTRSLAGRRGGLARGRRCSKRRILSFLFSSFSRYPVKRVVSVARGARRLTVQPWTESGDPS